MEDFWRKYAQEKKYPCFLILIDLEDKEEYPVYFKSEKELTEYKKKILSEMKTKIKKIIYIAG